MTQDCYTLTGPAFAHVKSALLLAADHLIGWDVAVEITAALDSLETAVCSPVERPLPPYWVGDEYADGDVEMPRSVVDEIRALQEEALERAEAEYGR